MPRNIFHTHPKFYQILLELVTQFHHHIRKIVGEIGIWSQFFWLNEPSFLSSERLARFKVTKWSHIAPICTFHEKLYDLKPNKFHKY